MSDENTADVELSPALPRQQSLNHTTITEHIDDFLARIVSLEKAVKPVVDLVDPGLTDRVIMLEEKVENLLGAITKLGGAPLPQDGGTVANIGTVGS